MTKFEYLSIRRSFDLSFKKRKIVGHLLIDSVLISAIYFAWNQSISPLSRLLSVPLISIVLFRSFSLMHDAVHKVVSKNKFINEGFGIVSGGICLLPFEQWRRSHLEHHTWSGNLDKDPVTAFVTIFPKLPKTMQNTLNFFWKSWLPLLAMVQYLVFWTLASKTTLKSKVTGKLILSLLSPAVAWGTVVCVVPLHFTFFALLPAVLLYFVAVEVVNFPHHLQLPQYRGETRFAFWEQYKISRSCMYPRWFASLVVLNFNYHTEHHLFPDVPWYHLPTLHEPVKKILGPLYNSDQKLDWILANKSKTLNDVIQYSDDPQQRPNSNIAA